MNLWLFKGTKCLKKQVESPTFTATFSLVTSVRHYRNVWNNERSKSLVF